MTIQIVNRAGWGANPLQTPAAWIGTPQQELWLHHTGSKGLHGASGMQQLQAGALAGGYVDLEYTFVVDNPTPVIYESRGPGRDTAATGGHNSISQAICVMGNFEAGDVPSEELIDKLAELVAYGHDLGWWPSQITGPHKNASGNSTACCGNTLIAQIPEINRRAAGAPSTGQPPKSAGGALNICRTPSGHGYYIVAADGGVFCYGDAKFFGSMGGVKLNAPVVDMAVRPQGDGYWLAASDGGVFCFGKAPMKGSMGGQHINSPVVSIDCDAEGDGYWLLAEDGRVFTFGKTAFYGAATGKV